MVQIVDVFCRYLVAGKAAHKVLIDIFTNHKVGNNGINANFVFPYICIFFYRGIRILVNVSKCEIRCHLVKGKGLTFQGRRIFRSFKF